MSGEASASEATYSVRLAAPGGVSFAVTDWDALTESQLATVLSHVTHYHADAVIRTLHSVMERSTSKVWTLYLEDDDGQLIVTPRFLVARN